MHIMFDSVFNEGGISSFADPRELMVRHTLDTWLPIHMPLATWKCTLTETGLQLRFDHPANYTEFVLKWTRRNFRIVP